MGKLFLKILWFGVTLDYNLLQYQKIMRKKTNGKEDENEARATSLPLKGARPKMVLI